MTVVGGHEHARQWLSADSDWKHRSSMQSISASTACLLRCCQPVSVAFRLQQWQLLNKNAHRLNVFCQALCQQGNSCLLLQYVQIGIHLHVDHLSKLSLGAGMVSC